ncbi:hypothetical protein BD769DRAFT_1361276 [Suillus cothurnatus]|nr:hypothetical protein BD769DRAFT_1367577 [Suillus cothurnatus]KAG2121578.1 hypothetical protein BD769DRAFT_1361276 [Suillus cothurnatus]
MNCQVLPRCHINSLPVELLSYIFTLATHDCDSEEGHAFSPESVTLPTVLASVNSRWREIALSIPTLWSTLSIDLKALVRQHPNNTFSFNQQPFDQILNIITRSKHSSLDILIDARDPKSHELIGCMSPPFTETSQRYTSCMPYVFFLLLAEKERWRSLEVISDTLNPLCAALRLLSSYTPIRKGSSASHLQFIRNGLGAPRLEFLKLKRTNDYYSAHAEQFLPPLELDSLPFAVLIGGPSEVATDQDQSGGSHQDILAQVPAPCYPLSKLRHVDIIGVPLNWAGFLRTLGAGHCIQSLELSHHDGSLRPTFDQFSAIIKACPLLRRLVIRASGPVPVLSQPHHHRGVMSLPMLEELHLGYIKTDSLDALFSRLDAPNLVTLFIEDVNPAVPRSPYETGTNAEHLLNYCATGFSQHPAAVSRTSMPFPKLQRLSLNRVHASVIEFGLFMSAFSKLHHLSLLRTPNALAALLLDADATMPRPALTSILVCPVTQPEVLKLKQLENVGAVLTGDVEGLSPSIPVETITGSYYSDWAMW